VPPLSHGSKHLLGRDVRVGMTVTVGRGVTITVGFAVTTTVGLAVTTTVGFAVTTTVGRGVIGSQVPGLSLIPITSTLF